MNRIRTHVAYAPEEVSERAAPTRHERPWTAAEIVFVRMNYLRLSNGKMAAQLERSRDSVAGVLARLDLRRDQAK